jgi:hypothetical protein
MGPFCPAQLRDEIQIEIPREVIHATKMTSQDRQLKVVAES